MIEFLFYGGLALNVIGTILLVRANIILRRENKQLTAQARQANDFGRHWHQIALQHEERERRRNEYQQRQGVAR